MVAHNLAKDKKTVYNNISNPNKPDWKSIEPFNTNSKNFSRPIIIDDEIDYGIKEVIQAGKATSSYEVYTRLKSDAFPNWSRLDETPQSESPKSKLLVQSNPTGSIYKMHNKQLVNVLKTKTTTPTSQFSSNSPVYRRVPIRHKTEYKGIIYNSFVDLAKAYNADQLAEGKHVFSITHMQN